MSVRTQIVIFGAGGHGKVIADILEKMGTYQIVGFLDSSKPKGSTIFDYKVLGNESALTSLASGTECIIAIGDNFTRAKIESQILEISPEIKFTIAIHPSAQIARGVKIGAGTVVMANAVINSDTVISKHCKINTGAIIDHDNIISDFAAVEPGATLGGTVTVGEFTTVALGAKVKHGIKIGSHTVIGAGSTVVQNIPGNCVAYGNPAKVIRARKPEDKYL